MLLAPTAAVIAGAIAFPALAALYLLKLRRRPVRVSSTLLWRQAYEDLEANIPWRWVRPSWLVLLHLLLVTLLVLVIGRPALSDAGPAAARMVFIIDRSASMNAPDGAGGLSRLQEARQRAEAIIDDSMRFGRRIEAAVIAVAAEAVPLTPLTSDRRRLLEVVGSLEPTDQGLDLPAALKLAEAVLGKQDRSGSESSGPAGPAPLVIFLSDGCVPKGTLLSVAGAAVRLERVGPVPHIPVARDGAAAPTAEYAGTDNLGIVALNARRDADNPGIVRVFCQVQNALGRPREVPILLSLAGIERHSRAVALPAAQPGAPAIQSVMFELQTRDAGMITLRLPGGDILGADDTASIEIAAPRAASILLVTPDEPAAESKARPSGTDTELTPSWLLESILTELRPASLRTVTESQSDPLVRAALGVYDLIIFDRVSPGVLPRVPAVLLGAGLPAAGIRVPTEPPAAQADRDFVMSWDRTHPLLRDVSLDTVFALGPAAIVPVPVPKGSAAGESPVKRTDIALGATGPMICTVEAAGVRHVVVAFDLARSNWGLQVGFPIFLANAIDFLTVRAVEQSGAAYRTSDPIDVAVAANAGAITIEGPARRQIRIPDDPQAGQVERTVSIGRLERVGSYILASSGGAGARPRPSVLALNLLDPAESSLATSESLDVRSRGAAASGPQPGIPREIGHYLLLAVLVLLAVEWIIYARTARI